MTFAVGGIPVITDTLPGGGKVVRWTSGMRIDADGAPTAYAPAGSGLRGLDALGNAGEPGDWWGLACDVMGEPWVQGASDPAPGFYVSTTALVDPTKGVANPRRYVNALEVPYVSVPRELLRLGVRRGDLALVSHDGLDCCAIVADVGPHGKIGEGSIALAEALGIPGSPRTGGVASGVRFQIAIGTASSPRWPRDPGDIHDAVVALLLTPR